MWRRATSDEIDIRNDFDADTPNGKDSDSSSPSLRTYQRLLWSKPLPSGAMFELSEATPGVYLHHWSQLGEFKLSSDVMFIAFLRDKKLEEVRDRVPDRVWREFDPTAFTIGGRFIFPSNKVGNTVTINGARAFHPRIKDRFDLTLECIRRHYVGGDSPLSGVLGRYADFFALFGSFRGYVDFFLLQDIVSADYAEIRFLSPFTSFDKSPVPADVRAFSDYLRASTRFVRARNARIVQSRRR